MSGILGNLDFHSILNNVQSILIPFTQVVLMICFISGVSFIFKGVILLRNFGQSQNMFSGSKGEIVAPLVYIFIGAVLINIPLSSQVISMTIFGQEFSDLFSTYDPATGIKFDTADPNNVSVSTEPTFIQAASAQFGYTGSLGAGSGQEWSDLINVLVKFIQFIGFIAFVRGWFILTSIANHGGGQHGTFSKGLIHIIGGIIAINFIPFMHAIAAMVF